MPSGVALVPLLVVVVLLHSRHSRCAVAVLRPLSVPEVPRGFDVRCGGGTADVLGGGDDLPRAIGSCAVGEVSGLDYARVVALVLHCAACVYVPIHVFLVVLAVVLALRLAIDVGDDDRSLSLFLLPAADGGDYCLSGALISEEDELLFHVAELDEQRIELGPQSFVFCLQTALGICAIAVVGSLVDLHSQS